ncbi:glucoamylase family protein [Arthrospiribacter ruber]|uniref:Glycoamylase-like domain-containing protein n=1 Tax=Arthrospiribacter ruber TaxID=2487934 RepID=A0A951IZX1_9BACT|nr:glucoamylase family protein [Arthrospiribacter ruber]MBW3468683.1 hypothetical protein [Arthrospiribacter ruber]
MKNHLFILLFLILSFPSCQESEGEFQSFALSRAIIGDHELPMNGSVIENIPLDRSIQLEFSSPVSIETIEENILLKVEEEIISYNFNLFSNNTLLTILPSGALEAGKNYQIKILDGLQSNSGSNIQPVDLFFKTVISPLTLVAIEFLDADILSTGRITEIALSPEIKLRFSEPVSLDELEKSLEIEGMSSSNWQVTEEPENVYKVVFSDHLQHYRRYTFIINEFVNNSGNGSTFSKTEFTFYTGASPQPVMPQLEDDQLLELIQRQTFKYFWDFGHENSGMARERSTSGNLVTTGGSGFGVMAMIVGVERGFISREEALDRWENIIDFLENADRFHGAWPHWLNGNTGQTIPFSAQDDGGDLVETALLLQGLLTLKTYLNEGENREKSLIEKIQSMYEEVEWSFYTREENVLYWHWSPNFSWAMDLKIQGYNECLIAYILAAASPTFPIDKSVYDSGWARNGAMRNGSNYFGITLPLGKEMGGPLFFAHYSYLGIDPRNLSDQYADYWVQNVNHSKINRTYVNENPRGFVGYSDNNWGLTASDNESGYSAHSPLNDRGVITPTAAISSIPYTPEASMAALNFFYYQLGDRLWGEYGFYDAFNLTEDWYADTYLAIDQGPIIIMIENYRSGLLWDLMKNNKTFTKGLNNLNFNY